MSELDDILLRLGAEPAPAGLAGIEQPVMAGLGRRREAQLARSATMRTLAVAGCVAMLVGTAGTLLPAAPASAEPLLGVPEAAPSHLLAD